MIIKRLLHSPASIAVLVICASILCASLAATYLFGLIRDDIIERMTATMEASIYQAKQELRGISSTTSYWANNIAVRHAAQQLQLESNRSQQRFIVLNSTLTAIVKTEHFRDYKFLDQGGDILLSGSILSRELLHPAIPQSLVNEAWHGKVVITPPFTSQLSWRDSDGTLRKQLPTMMAIAPVRDWLGHTIALFAFEFDPDHVFVPAFLQNQVGNSGQTYAIDKNGLLLTASKFNKQLRQAKILDDTHLHASLQLHIVDPGENLTQSRNLPFSPPADATLSLTAMARSLIQGNSGSNLNGYRNYLGIPVIGVWRWDKELNMGIATESEVGDVYRVYRSILFSVIISIIFVITITISAVMFYRRFNAQRLATLEQHDAIINETKDSFITIDEYGVIRMANPAVEDLFGFRNSDLVGQPISRLLPALTPAPDTDVITVPDIHQTHKLDGYHHDGRRIPIAVLISPLTHSDKKLFICVMRDISEQYRHEQAMIAAKEAAESANRAKSEFLTKMSHELRTPLNAIIGFSQLLLSDKLNDSQKESLEMIQGSGKHLLSLINDVLDLAKIESGHMAISIEKVDLRELIVNILPLFDIELVPLSLSLTTHFDTEEAIFVQADHLRLRQVLINLISNAIKYNRPQGYINIEVTTRNRDMVCIAVHDSGYGISESLQNKLFEPFNRLDKEDTDIQGTGIGLAISQELMQLMNGKLYFNSIPDQGTTFSIEILRVSAPELSQYDSLPEQADITQPATDRISVLYIEDNPLSMTLIRKYLAHQSRYQLLQAGSAETGLVMIREHRPDIILIDINLPGMDGYEALAQLQKEGWTTQLKIIALSANARPDDIQNGLDAGFDEYLTKPIGVEQLLVALDRVSDSLNSQ